ncbi:MAG: 50S ribosomal protein L18 [Candidatus Methanoperedens sp.]|nr:50S ribosomal protein L18 [Candidatus Methanoperedens sp.]MCE8427165.1 50S ribosomal protein L18 [Candidatus Methanoperedens sp.]
MATGARYRVRFRRARIGKTDYRARKQLLFSRKPRLVVRRSLEHTNIQLIVPEKNGDEVIISANTIDLKKYGYTGGTGNLPSAYLAGLLLGYRAKKKGQSVAILDIGLSQATRGGRVFAALKGAIDSGLEIPHDPEIFPKEDRIMGKHIDKYRKTDIAGQFQAAKEKIQSEFR